MSAEDDLRARDAYAGAAVLAMLVLVWGAVSLVFLPWRPFAVPSVVQSVASALALGFLGWTWKRPVRPVAAGVSVLAVSYALLLLPWTTIGWCRLGRPLEAFTVPQIATVTMALVIPSIWPVGVAVMAAFVAETLFVYAYARHVGLEAQIPITEPMASACITVLGISLFVMRYRRRAVARKYLRVRAEVEALARMAPLFTSVRDELGVNVAAITAAANGPEAPERMGRALDRLDQVRAALDGLVAGPAAKVSTRDTERALLDREAQLVMTIFTALSAVLGCIAVPLHWQLGFPSAPFVAALTIVCAALFAYLVITRRRPSERRAIAVLLFLFAAILSLASYTEVEFAGLHRPYSPFLPHKLLMVALGFVAASRPRLGATLIVVTAAVAMGLYFGLHLGANANDVPVAEPLVLLTFVLIALASLRMREQRRLASVRLLQAEAEASALHRRAMLFLALCDRLNSPLQTLVVDAARSDPRWPPESQERIRAAVDRLVALSHGLAARDPFVPPGSSRASLDADAELRRRF